MPSKSPEQRRMMRAVANNPAFAKKVGVPTSVGKEFVRADKVKGYSTKAKVNRPDTAHGKMDMPFESTKPKGGIMKKQAGKAKKYQMGGMTNAAAMSGRPMGLKKGGGIESKGKTKGKMIVMRKGGSCK
jgi:hypothetical protein